MRPNPEKTRARVLADFSESAEDKAVTAQLVGQGIVYEPWVRLLFFPIAIKYNDRA
jgi:hypothetical protein